MRPLALSAWDGDGKHTANSDMQYTPITLPPPKKKTGRALGLGIESGESRTTDGAADGVTTAVTEAGNGSVPHT